MPAPFSFHLLLSPRPLVKSKIREHQAASSASLCATKAGQGTLALHSSMSKVQSICPQFAGTLQLLQMWGFGPAKHLNTAVLEGNPPPKSARKSGKSSPDKWSANNLVFKVVWLLSEEQGCITTSASSWLLVLAHAGEEGGKLGSRVQEAG